MRRLLITSFAAFLASASAALAGSNDVVVVYGGDSRTDPLGRTSGVGLQGTWPYYLSLMDPFFHDATTYNFAHDGATTADILKQFSQGVFAPPVAAHPKSAYLFMWAGINDLSQGNEATPIYDRLKSIWAKSRDLGYKVIAFTVGPACMRDDYLNRFRQLDALIMIGDAKLYDYLVVPEKLFSSCDDLKAMNLKVTDVDRHDAGHPNQVGNMKIAAQVDALMGHVVVHQAQK